MKIRKIYSNKDEIFPDISFNDGLSVIFGEVRNPKDLKKDSHNLGKTILISLIEFLLLKKISDQLFLKKHYDRFKDFTFYLEVSLNSGKYLTIRRDVENNSKISFKKHETEDQDYRDAAPSDWDHFEIPLGKAKDILDTYLDLSVIDDWNFRTGISYFLRDQNDYGDIFQIEKFLRSDHIDWKPYLAKLLGLDSDNVKNKYLLDKKITDKTSELVRLQNKTDVGVEEYDRLKGVIEIKEGYIKQTEEQVERFNFYEEERRINRNLVEVVETSISNCNNDLYGIDCEIERIQNSLSNNLKFDLDEIKAVFEDANIYFKDDIVKDYESLLAFNKKMYTERKKYLNERLSALKKQRDEKLVDLKELELKRCEMLEFLRGEDAFTKLKQLQNMMVQNKAEVIDLRKQLEVLDSIEKLKLEIEKLETERKALVSRIDKEIKEGNDTYRLIRTSFNDIITKVLNRSAILSIKLNSEGNIEFDAGILKDEKTLETTSEGEGTSWKKILCAAFDLSVLRAYSSSSFFKFAYHDGILEGLDNRKKKNFLEVVREYVHGYNIQYILTVISDDLPRDEEEHKILFDGTEIIRALSDEGDSGRLFKMPKF